MSETTSNPTTDPDPLAALRVVLDEIEAKARRGLEIAIREAEAADRRFPASERPAPGNANFLRLLRAQLAYSATIQRERLDVVARVREALP